LFWRSDDFEVSIFLTEISSRHSLLVKNKTFQEKTPKIQSNNGNKMTGVVTIRDEDEEDVVNLQDIPAAQHPEDDDQVTNTEHGLDSYESDDKKRLGFNTTYEGFSIWGRVLCLFIERKGGPTKSSAGTQGNSQALMQDWIQSTQEQKDDDM
jgi:hypothetical protein